MSQVAAPTSKPGPGPTVNGSGTLMTLMVPVSLCLMRLGVLSEGIWRLLADGLGLFIRFLFQKSDESQSDSGGGNP